jgi:hypothetical protein
MERILVWITLLSLLATQGAYADGKAANVCASSLQPTARLVFDAVVAQPHPELPLRSLIEQRVRELIFMDRLRMGAARPAAEAASLCLRISRNCSADNC